MATLVIPDLDDGIRAELEHRAARHGHSLEKEVQAILENSVGGVKQPADPNLARAIAAIVDPIGGIELDIPPRTVWRDPPRFDDE